MTEIEIKAWVEDADAVQKRLRRTFAYSGEFLKDDTYFNPPAVGKEGYCTHDTTVPEAGVETFRLRIQDSGATVTFKRKHVSQGMEINEENEFAVSDVKVFMTFITRLGCSVSSRKRKRTILYRGRGVSVELNHIDMLGWFLEIEKMCDGPGEEEDVRAHLYTILDDLDIPRSNIEPRFYTDLLKERQSGDASGLPCSVV